MDEYNENGRRTELIRGLVIEKMGKTPLHRTATSLLYDLLTAQLPQGYSVWKEEPITLADSEPEPDISVTRGQRKDFARAHPRTAELVIEIAVSNPALDRENAGLYAEAGVKEYWIVIGLSRTVEVYRRPQKGRYLEKQLLSENDTLQCKNLPTIRIGVADLFL